MSEKFTITKGQEFVNDDGEILKIESTTYAPYPAILRETINGAFTNYGYMSIDSIYNFVNN